MNWRPQIKENWRKEAAQNKDRTMGQVATEKSVVLLICDISGYTRFMLASHEAQMHGYVIIAELMQAVLKQTRAPLQVSKLEGDAVFLYSVLPEQGRDKQERMQELRKRVHQFFWAFEEKLMELVESNICSCNGCMQANKLRLKIVIHSGVAVFHQIGKFSELSGVDVILVHRLLKNSQKQDKYILLSEPAREILWPEPDTPGEAGEEQYEDLGVVKTFTLAPLPRLGSEMYQSGSHNYAAFRYKAKNILWRIFQARLMWLHLKPKPRLTNLALAGEDATSEKPQH